jgi:hypothetical protein
LHVLFSQIIKYISMQLKFLIILTLKLMSSDNMQPIRISWYNIANAAADDKSETHRYSQREPNVIDQIIKSNSDVISLSELRMCYDVNLKKRRMPEELAINLLEKRNIN